MVNKDALADEVPKSCRDLLNLSNTELRSAIPDMARDWDRMIDIENTVLGLSSDHRFICDDSRSIDQISGESAHLVVTSPPYFDLKDYSNNSNQLGEINNYSEFAEEIGKVWAECYEKLIPGGRMCIVVGDILQSRREVGRHRVLPLHSRIQEQCREIGFDCLAPILWAKIGNASLEAGGNARFLGKPYEPNAVVKNDVEYILLFRKPGDYRSPTKEERILSTIQVDDHKRFFSQIWTDIDGESSEDHPAPYPVKLAERLIKMFSFVGDIILDPFAGVGSTTIAASNIGRDSISIELNAEYLNTAKSRLSKQSSQEKIA